MTRAALTITRRGKRSTVTSPGVYKMATSLYDGDPVPGGSLSSSGARRLLPPSCPAIFAYEREHPPPPRSVFDFGTAAHRRVLGTGPEIVPIYASDWRTKSAREQRDAAHEVGKVPLLIEQYQQVKEMADALVRHPIASVLLRPSGCIPEAALFWVDQESGTWLRARLDTLPPRGDGRLIIPEYKTAQSANPEKWARSAADYGYHQQAAWYREGAVALDLGPDPVVVFIVQEKTPPYLISPIQLDTVAMRIGATLNRRAIALYTACAQSGYWPGYTDDVAHTTLPFWYERQHLEDL